MSKQFFNAPAVVQVKFPGGKQRLKIEGLSGLDVWVTSIAGILATNHQILYGLDSSVYVNSFNRRLDVQTIEGIHALTTCTGSAASPEFLRFFNKHAIDNSSEPVRMSYSGILIVGFPVRLVIGRFSADKGLEGQTWTMNFQGYMSS